MNSWNPAWNFEGRQGVIAERKWPQPKPAVFLDRDGVLIQDNHYAVHYQDVTIKKEMVKALEKLNSLDLFFFVVSNQSGVGREYFSFDQVCDLHQKLDRDLKEQGLSLTEWLFCPYHKTKAKGKYLKDSFCRKPYPGMVLSLCERHPLDLDKSVMIGDQVTDDLWLSPLSTFHLREKKDLSLAKAPVFSDPEELISLFQKKLKL